MGLPSNSLERKTGLGPAASRGDAFAFTLSPAAARRPLGGAVSVAGSGTIISENAERQPQGLSFIFGAENGARTRDLNLGKVALYQLSYFRVGIAKVAQNFLFCKLFVRNIIDSCLY